MTKPQARTEERGHTLIARPAIVIVLFVWSGLGVLLLTGWLFLSRIPWKELKGDPIPPFFIVLVIVIFVLTLAFFVSEIMLTPYRLEVNYEQETFSAHFLGKRDLTVAAQDVVGFSEGYPSMLSETGPVLSSIILYLKDGSIVELGRLVPERIGNMLRQRGVKCYGKETTWYPYMKLRYRFSS